MTPRLTTLRFPERLLIIANGCAIGRVLCIRYNRYRSSLSRMLRLWSASNPSLKQGASTENSRQTVISKV